MPLTFLACAAAGGAAVSWARLAIVRNPAPDRAFLPESMQVLATVYLVVLVYGTMLAHRAVVRSVSRRRPEVRTLLPWALLLVGIAAFTLPLLSNDLFSVLAYVDLQWNTSVSPFTLPRPGLRASRFYPLVSPVWNWAPCVYGPVQLVYWAPTIYGGIMAAIGIAKVLALVAALGTVALLYRYCGSMPAGGAAAFAITALNPILWTEGAGQAHSDLLTAFFLAAWLLLGVAAPPLAAVALGLAVASKLTALVPAGMYFVFLLSRPGAVWRRLRVTTVASLAFVGTVVACYEPFWTGVWTLKMPLRFLGQRWPTNSVFELLFHAAQWTGSPAKILAVPLSSASGLITGLLAIVGVIGAWRAPDFRALVGVAAKVLLLSMTLTSAVYHPWYLLPCVVLAVELREKAWRRWFLFVSSASLFLDASCLLPVSSLPHGLYRAASLGLVLVLVFQRIGPRLASLWRPETEPNPRPA